MLTPEQTAALRDRAAQITDPINDYLLEDIARRISEAGQLTSTASYQIWRAQQLGVSQREIKKRLRKLLKVSHRELRQLLTQSAEVGYDFDIKHLPYVQAVPFHRNETLQQIVAAAVQLAQEDFTNLTKTLGMVDPYGNALPLQDAYRSCTDYAFKQVITGAADYNTAIRRATRNLAEKGVRVIEYESGVHTSLEAAVRRNIMGGLGLMQEQITQMNHDQLGADGWEISAHANSAPDHEPIQGKQYSDAAYEALNNSLVRRIGTLNCGHAAFPIILGVSSPQYTPEELDKFRADNEKGVTVDGKHYTGYEATQMQRKLERSMRAQKRRILVAEASGDKDTLAIAQTRLQRLRQEYTRFSKASGLRTQQERLEVAGFGPKQAERSMAAETETGKQTSGKVVEKKPAPAILNEEEKGAVTWYIGGSPYEVNRKLRDGQLLTDAESTVVNNLDSAISKLPVYKGTVIRDLNFMSLDEFKSFAARYAVGNEITEASFVSATTLTVYQESPQVRMRIKSKTARDLREFNPDESEVLFPRNTKFRVLSVHRENNTFILEVEEK